jgi:hypothetical protein
VARDVASYPAAAIPVTTSEQIAAAAEAGPQASCQAPEAPAWQ